MNRSLPLIVARRCPRWIALPALAGLVAGLASPAVAQPVSASMVVPGDDEIIREGADERRETLNEMELTPFPLEWWDLVSDWRLGEAPTPETTDGKVVLIVTFAGWYPPSLRSLGVMSRLGEEHAEDGLLVVGVHDMEAWHEGVAAAEGRNVTFAVGHDAENKFRQTLMVDQDPDFYLIDRAGQLRYADIETSSVEAAVQLLLDESREDAATVIDRIADATRRADLEARRTGRINQSATLREIPAVPFTIPSPDAYANIRWPRPPRNQNTPQGQEAEAIARPLALPRDGWWPEAPSPLGRATVVYFVDRRIPQTVDMIDDMDALQRRYSRDLNVIGSLSPIAQDNSQQTTTPARPATDPMDVLRRAHDNMGLAHSLVLDPAGALINAAGGGTTTTFNFNSSGGVSPTFAAVASSDGVVRWFGDATSAAFESAVREVARLDPGVKARRAAEDEYVRRHGQ